MIKPSNEELSSMIFNLQDFFEAFGENHNINTRYSEIREIYWDEIVYAIMQKLEMKINSTEFAIFSNKLHDIASNGI